MPPKNKSKRKSQGKRKNSQQGQSQGSSPSTANASQATSRTGSPPTTATSSTVEQELITPGALDLRLSNPTMPVVDEDSSLATTPTVSDVMSDDLTPNPNTDDVEYQDDDGVKTPTAEVPESAIKGASAAAAAATASTATQNTAAAPAASTAQDTAQSSNVSSSPPKSSPPTNPFVDTKPEPIAKTAGPSKKQQAKDEETTFDEVPLEPISVSSKPAATAAAAAAASSAESRRALRSDEVPTLNAAVPAESVKSSPPAPAPLSSPSKLHETGNPFLKPGETEESAEDYRARTHLGAAEPRPSEPFMQMDAAPDSAPTDNFVSNGGANRAATEEPQNVWAPGQQGFERSEHAPSTSAAKDQGAAAAAPSNNFVVDDTSTWSASDEDEEPNFSLEGQTGLWKAPATSYNSQQPSGRQLTPAEGTLPHNVPPASYPFPAHTTAAAQADNQSPKSLLPSDPHLPLPETLEPRTNEIASLGPRSTDNVREGIELSDLPEENLDGFLNPWTRSQHVLAQQQPRAPSPATEEAAISTPDLTKIRSVNVARVASSSSGRSNEPLMPANPLFAGKKIAHLNKISNAQLRSARPSIMTPRGPNQRSLKNIPENTSSGRSSKTGRKVPPPPQVVDADLDDVHLDQPPFHSRPRDRHQSLNTRAPMFMRAQNQGRGRWAQWNSRSRRFRFVVFAIIVVIIALVVGLAAGLVTRQDDNASESAVSMSNKSLKRAKWVPKPGDSWEFQTRNRLKDRSQLNERHLERNPTGAAVFDIDLFQNEKELIEELHANGAKVICSFSAGTVESWRPDANYFPSHAQGLGLVKAMGTRWLNIKDGTVQHLMRKRIDLAVNKDCDAVDPSFVDAYQWPVEGIGFELSEGDAAAYVKMLAEHAHSRELAIGLRRAPEIAARLMSEIDFSVCENCSSTRDCEAYQQFIDAGKPVFHVEYANATARVLGETSKESLKSICNVDGSEGFSTIVKRHNQDEWIVDCLGR